MERKNKRKHDQLGEYGFNVDPELLAHDLALLMLSKQDGIEALHEAQLYDAYTKLLDAMEVEIDARIRYDLSLSHDSDSPSSSSSSK